MNSNKKKEAESTKIFNIQTFLRDTESKRRRVSRSVGRSRFKRRASMKSQKKRKRMRKMPT